MKILGINNRFDNNKFNYRNMTKRQILIRPNEADTFVSSQVYFRGANVNTLKLMKQVKRLTKAEALTQGYTPVYSASSLHKALSKAKESKIVHEFLVEEVEKYLNTPRQKIILMRDIKLDKSKRNNWMPIETFGGDFNGNGHKITGLRINQPQSDNIGLFKSVKNAKIENLILEDVDVVGANNTGAIVGINNRNFNNTADYRAELPIKNCLVHGKVMGKENTGGIVGDINNAVVENCIAKATVVGSGSVGGVVGGNHYSEVINSVSESNVSGKFRIGGVVGFNVISGVKNCSSKGKVQGENLVGDIIGYDYSLI